MKIDIRLKGTHCTSSVAPRGESRAHWQKSLAHRAGWCPQGFDFPLFSRCGRSLPEAHRLRRRGAGRPSPARSASERKPATKRTHRVVRAEIETHFVVRVLPELDESTGIVFVGTSRREHVAGNELDAVELVNALILEVEGRVVKYGRLTS
jgi:hypothetical protein